MSLFVLSFQNLKPPLLFCLKRALGLKESFIEFHLPFRKDLKQHVFPIISLFFPSFSLKSLEPVLQLLSAVHGAMARCLAAAGDQCLPRRRLRGDRRSLAPVPGATAGGLRGAGGPWEPWDGDVRGWVDR